MAKTADMLKLMAGEKAAEFVQDGMRIGLGTGSTVYWTIRRLGVLVQNGLQITAVPTSKATEDLMAECGILRTDLSVSTTLDLTIDGADEIAPNLALSKGGGGALLREKIVATAAKQLIIVADQSKLVAKLGARPVPVEVVPFGWETTAKRIADRGFMPALRTDHDKPFVTDNGNFILDCDCGLIENAADVHHDLKILTGVIETGLFVAMVHQAIIASESGVEIIEPKH